MEWLNILAGLLVGIIVGITGVGGGSLMSPLLILVFGVAPATAIGTDLWFAAITKSVGGYIHHRHASVDMGVVRLLALGSVPAALMVGLWLWYSGNGHVDSSLLSVSLGIVLILTSISTLFRQRMAGYVQSIPIRSNPAFPAMKRIATVLAGALLGVMVTMTSVGAGALGATMLMMLYPRRLSLRRLVGTDIAHAVPIAFVGGVIHLLFGTVDLSLLGLLLLGSVPGIALGARLASTVPERIVQPVLAAVLLIAGLKLAL
ncbi:sulfite exporter TauE/SafE family protein [Sphingomonas sp.]|uniref:sulfite exporter TauE/SafE family protein n=1 Tax=Sphingomonas sp. TaxID=28214 RepID=UPI002D101C43|nr:sulfite exporter TauE/SafE family protein [Sphingomonas sp.]HTG39449.1 sulfite exporter TauE/SafE family protein [Sphingomonas sp.]